MKSHPKTINEQTDSSAVRDKFEGRNPSLRVFAAVLMIWLYERGQEVLRIETRFDNASNEFELIWHRPDGTTDRERFATEAAFRSRLESVEAALKTEHWNSNGSPQILPAGWKDGAFGSFKMN